MMRKSNKIPTPCIYFSLKYPWLQSYIKENGCNLFLQPQDTVKLRFSYILFIVFLYNFNSVNLYTLPRNIPREKITMFVVAFKYSSNVCHFLRKRKPRNMCFKLLSFCVNINIEITYFPFQVYRKYARKRQNTKCKLCIFTVKVRSSGLSAFCLT